MVRPSASTLTLSASPDQSDIKNEAGQRGGNEYEQTLTAGRVCEEALGCKTVLCWGGTAAFGLGEVQT